MGKPKLEEIAAVISDHTFGGVGMIPRIKSLKPLDNYVLHVVFDDGKEVVYDVKDDIAAIDSYKDLENIYGLFQQAQLDQSRTCVFWSKEIDLPSDAIYEQGKEVSCV